MLRGNKGFTLMEILVAMAIVGILSSVGFTSFTTSIKKTRDAERKGDLATISKALEAYNSDFGVYPASQSDRIAGCGDGDPDNGIDGTQTCSWGGAFSLDNGKVYLKTLPRENQNHYFYIYAASSDQKKYQIFAYLENSSDQDIEADITTICNEYGQECNYGVASSNASVTEVLQ
jgi:prepilin-type N-terminal cleavage/methylation domain-containing protein